MASEWNWDFSFEYFRKILNAALDNFQCHRICQAPEFLEKAAGRPLLFLRHDVDIDLTRALQMARIENELGIQATYMVIVDSPLYRLEDAGSKRILKELESMEHEVALHFVISEEINRTEGYPGSLVDDIQISCERLQQITGTEVQSVSFHRPNPRILGGDLRIAGRINAYSRDLMAWYISDSRGCWRDGEPLPKLLNPDKPLLQLLVHPIWWGEQSLAPEERLESFFVSATQGASANDAWIFDRALSSQIGVHRSGLSKP